MCYGMGCMFENSRGECTYKNGDTGRMMCKDETFEEEIEKELEEA